MWLLNKYFNAVQSAQIGLDIGSGAVKLVGLRPAASGWTAACAARSTIAPSDPQDSDSRYAHTLEALRQCLEQAAIPAGRHLACALAGPDAAVRGFSFPLMPLSEIKKAVYFEAQQVCPIDIAHSSLDYQLLEPITGQEQPSQKITGLLVAGLQEAIDLRARLISAAGAKAALIDAEELAALNCLSQLQNLDDYRAVALIDLGYHRTHIILLGSDGLPFVRNLDTGFLTMIEQAAGMLNSDRDTVRQTLQNTTHTQIPDQTLTAFHQAARGLVMNINETLRYYASLEKGQNIEIIYLYGGGALLPPMVHVLCEALQTETAVFNPFEYIHVEDSIPGAELLNTLGPAYTVAAGLAMRRI